MDQILWLGQARLPRVGAMETPQHGNVSMRKCLKTGFEEFPFFLGNPSKLENVEGFPNIFEAFPNI